MLDHGINTDKNQRAPADRGNQQGSCCQRMGEDQTGKQERYFHHAQRRIDDPESAGGRATRYH